MRHIYNYDFVHINISDYLSVLQVQHVISYVKIDSEIIAISTSERYYFMGCPNEVDFSNDVCFNKGDQIHIINVE